MDEDRRGRRVSLRLRTRADNDRGRADNARGRAGAEAGDVRSTAEIIADSFSDDEKLCAACLHPPLSGDVPFGMPLAWELCEEVRRRRRRRIMMMMMVVVLMTMTRTEGGRRGSVLVIRRCYVHQDLEPSPSQLLRVVMLILRGNPSSPGLPWRLRALRGGRAGAAGCGLAAPHERGPGDRTLQRRALSGEDHR
jgi:hypothetical protein